MIVLVVLEMYVFTMYFSKMKYACKSGTTSSSGSILDIHLQVDINGHMTKGQIQ